MKGGNVNDRLDSVLPEIPKHLGPVPCCQLPLWDSSMLKCIVLGTHTGIMGSNMTGEGLKRTRLNRDNSYSRI